MERQEIEAELNEVERDLADIARRAHIAASNLRSVADAAYGYMDADAWQLIQYATALDSVKADVRKMKIELAETKASLFGAKPATVAAGEGGCGMKRLDELGVSPAPWFTVDDETLVCRWIDEEESVLSDVADCGRASDAALIAAAPELYEALREAVIDRCHLCGGIRKCKNDEGYCYVTRWRKALEKAGGAE